MDIINLIEFFNICIVRVVSLDNFEGIYLWIFILEGVDWIDFE